MELQMGKGSPQADIFNERKKSCFFNLLTVLDMLKIKINLTEAIFDSVIFMVKIYNKMP